MDTVLPLHDRLARLIAETFAILPDEVTPELAYGSIEQWDSVGHLDLLVAIQSGFGMPLTADLVAKLTSVRAIESHLAEAGIA